MRSAIYSESGKKLAGSTDMPRALDAAFLEGKFPRYSGGILYDKTDSGDISAIELPEEAAKAILGSLQVQTKDKFYQSMLTYNINPDELVNLCRRHHYKFEADRVVITIMLLNPSDEMQNILAEIFPEQEADIVAFSKQQYSVIYNVNEGNGELLELCNAIRDTIINELQTDTQIGVGEVVQYADKLHESYEKSLEAIAIGRRINYSGGVWAYNNLLPEILLSEVADIMLTKYADMNMKMKAVLDTETEQLVEELFKQNLNISQTAKQLFMHRNTLIYRLDKLQKTTGLDVGKFEDAVKLRLFLALHKLNRY